MERFHPAQGEVDKPSHALPTDLLQDAAKRLVFVAAIVTVIVLVNGFLNLFVVPDAARKDRVIRFVVPLTIALISAVLVVLVRRREFTARGMYWVGLVYLSAVALLAATGRHAAPLGEVTQGWSGVAVGILLFPVLIPTNPRGAALAGAIATAVDIGAYGVLVVAGRPLGEPTELLAIFRSDLLAIAVAYAIAGVVHTLGKKIAQARRLGSYELVDRLGAGGMGEVWLGRHARLARPAAIKLIRPVALTIADEDVRANIIKRFEREAQATSQLRSPHTIDVFDFGVADDGTFYYVMEHLEGLDLHKAVREHGPMRPNRVIHILTQVCHSLEEAHGAGLIHRDIKPANLYLCHYGQEYDYIKVLDFGLVKVEVPVDEALTEVGGITGTPAFMAPEQAKGRDVDARSDIYALGCVAYWLLTGNFVFRASSMTELLLAHVSEPPPLPSAASKLPIPAELDQLIRDSLAKDPADRPASMAEFANRLATVPADRLWRQRDAKTWWDEHVSQTG